MPGLCRLLTGEAGNGVMRTWRHDLGIGTFPVNARWLSWPLSIFVQARMRAEKVRCKALLVVVSCCIGFLN
jgi:hypothetical protein